MSSKISIKDVFLKKFMSEKQLNPVSFDVTRTSIYFQKFNECLYDWSILNDWPIQKIDLLTPKSISLFKITKYLTRAVATCKRVKKMVQVLFFVLINKIFNAFMEAMIYSLFELTTRYEFFQQFLFLEIYQGLRKSSKNVKICSN